MKSRKPKSCAPAGPTRGTCAAITGLSGLAATERISNTAHAATAAREGGRIAGDRAVTDGAGADSAARFQAVTGRFCNRERGGSAACHGRAERHGADLVAGNLFDQGTLVSDTERETVRELSRNLAAPVIHDPPPFAAATTEQERRLLLLGRSADARASLAADYFARAQALRTPAVDLEAWAGAMLPEASGSRSGPLSRYELLGILASRRFEDPGWFVRLQGLGEANLLREMVTLQAISLMLDWERYRLDERRGAMGAARLALDTEQMRRLPGLSKSRIRYPLKARPILRFLFAPEIFRLGRDLAASVGRFRGLVAGLLKRPEPGSFSWKRLTAPHNRLLTLLGSLLVAGAMFPIAIGAGGLLSAAARAQTMEPGLFDEEDRGTRDLLSFFGELDLEPHGVLGDMLYLFNGGILALAGFLLIYHIVSGTVATARTGRSGFGGWQILRIVTAIALMAPLPGGMSGGQHIVVGLANLGGDFANTIWRSFSEASLVRGQPVAPGPASANWRSAIARTLLAAVCRHVANAEAVAAGDAAYIAVRTETGPGRVILHFDGRGGMPGDLCGSIRFDGLDGEGPGALAAAGHRDALEGLFPVIGELAARFGDHYVPGSQVYGQPLPGC